MKTAVVGVQLALCVLIFFLSDVAQGVTYGLTDDQEEAVIKGFIVIDKDGNNEITQDEISKAKTMNPTPLPSRALDDLSDAAHSRNGQLSYDLYYEVMQEYYLGQDMRGAIPEIESAEIGLPSNQISDAVAGVKNMKFDNEELDNIIKEAGIDSEGNVNLRNFKYALLGKLKMESPDEAKLAEFRENAELSD